MIRETKNGLRRQYGAVRGEISPQDRQRYDRKITRTVMALMSYKAAECILCYASMGSEIDTRALMEEALRQEKRLALPVTRRDKTITFHYVTDLGALAPGRYSIPEPDGAGEMFDGRERSVCIVPGIAFDREGYRLGYGGGYYDRFLHGYGGIKIGVCYHALLVRHLPRGQYDISVDMIVTEKGVYNIHA